MPSQPASATPPSGPMQTFEANVARVEQLIDIYGQLGKGPGKPAQWRSDIAGASIVMTITAVDTYFDDRLRSDFERRFDKLDPKLLAKIISRMLATTDGTDSTGESYVLLASALQAGHPRSHVIKQFADWVAAKTYQEPSVIANEIALFDVSNLWGRAQYCWEQKFGEKKPIEKMFREWAERRNGIAHRGGRSRGTTKGLTKARHGQSATRDEAVDCIEFFRRLIALVDYQLNQSIYKKQPRARRSRVAVFDLKPVTRPVKRKPRKTATVKNAKRVESIGPVETVTVGFAAD